MNQKVCVWKKIVAKQLPKEYTILVWLATSAGGSTPAPFVPKAQRAKTVEQNCSQGKSSAFCGQTFLPLDWLSVGPGLPARCALLDGHSSGSLRPLWGCSKGPDWPNSGVSCVQHYLIWDQVGDSFFCFSFINLSLSSPVFLCLQLLSQLCSPVLRCCTEPIF